MDDSTRPRTTEHDLDRFVDAQDRHGTFDQALAELHHGEKTTHWMWFVFPQIKGLGHSPTAQHYALSGLEEALAYLDHPVLGPRLRQCCDALLALEGKTADDVLGPVDAMKLRSSMTLFSRAARDEQVFTQVLEKYFEGRADDATDRLLA